MPDQPTTDTTNQPQSQPTDTPQLYAGKYKTVADLEKGIRSIAGYGDDKVVIGENGLAKTPDEAVRLYKALTAFKTNAKAHGVEDLGTSKGEDAKPANAAAPQQTDTPKPSTPAPGADLLSLTPAPVDVDSLDFDGLIKHAGLNVQAATEQWKKDGKLGDEQYAALKKVGVPKAVADRLMALEMKAAITSIEGAKVYHAKGVEVAGSPEAHETIKAWAANGGIDKAVLSALEASVKADPSKYPEVIRVIKAAYVKEKGGDLSAPNRTGSGVPAGSPALNSFKDLSKTMEALRRGTPEEKAAALERLKRTDDISRFM